jgi:hypothetical protein
MEQQQRTYTEQQLARLLRGLPQPVTIIPVGDRYAWSWQGYRGESYSFLEAMQDALTYIQVCYEEAIEKG